MEGSLGIVITNWAKFQHYKNRRPPWVKIYRELLDKPEWCSLSGDSGKLLIELWLLASERAELDGKVDLDSKTLAFRLRYASNMLAKLERSVQELADKGFITSASNVLARRYQHAIPETETETETETEKHSSKTFIDLIYEAYPRKVGKQSALKAIGRSILKFPGAPDDLLGITEQFAKATAGCDPQFIPHPATWFNQGRWADDPREWKLIGRSNGQRPARAGAASTMEELEEPF